MPELELFRRYPETRALDHIELASLPTPVDHQQELGAELGLAGLWIKRDDKTAPLYGGNKVRKLEFLLGHALAQGRNAVWTVGAIGSHHVLATCLYARQAGLDPHALHFPQPLTDHVREVLRALSTTRPQLELASSKNTMPIKLAKRRVSEWLSRTENPYYIPGGGSAPRGVLGYVNAALELARQIDNGELPVPDVIFVAAGTCGTLAGLELGCRLAELPCRVVGVRVVDKVLANPLVTANLANRAGKLLAEHGVSVPKIRASDIEMIDKYFGPGYGQQTPEGMAAIKLARSYSDIELDPTYTAKAFAGLMQYDAGSQRQMKNMLYWHTLSSSDLSELVNKADIDSNLPAEYQQFFVESS